MRIQTIKECLNKIQQEVYEAEPNDKTLGELKQALIHLVAYVEMKQVFKREEVA